MSAVALPRWVVGLLVGVCAVCLVAVAFLLGRVTAPAPPAAPTGVERAGPSTAAGVSDSPSVPPTETADAVAPTGQGLGSGPAASTGPVSTGPADGGTDAAAVAAYFRQIDAVAVENKASQDPQTLARNVLDQTMSGNMGAIDGLIATQRALEVRLGQILPPPSCREHHRRSVRLFGRAIALLERTRDAMSGQGDISSVAAEGRAIEVEARAVDALANDLRRAAGLAPVP